MESFLPEVTLGIPQDMTGYETITVDEIILYYDTRLLEHEITIKLESLMFLKFLSIANNKPLLKQKNGGINYGS